jgi:hypothetical protein
MRDATAASDLLKRSDARLMRYYPVSTRVSHVANDDEECSAPVELAEIQARLFSQSCGFLALSESDGFGGCSIRPSLDLNQPHASNRLCEHCQFQIQG